MAFSHTHSIDSFNKYCDTGVRIHFNHNSALLDSSNIAEIEKIAPMICDSIGVSEYWFEFESMDCPDETAKDSLIGLRRCKTIIDYLQNKCNQAQYRIRIIIQYYPIFPLPKCEKNRMWVSIDLIRK